MAPPPGPRRRCLHHRRSSARETDRCSIPTAPRARPFSSASPTRPPSPTAFSTPPPDPRPAAVERPPVDPAAGRACSARRSARWKGIWHTVNTASGDADQCRQVDDTVLPSVLCTLRNALHHLAADIAEDVATPEQHHELASRLQRVSALLSLRGQWLAVQRHGAL